jgi:hypothetical protein
VSGKKYKTKQPKKKTLCGCFRIESLVNPLDALINHREIERERERKNFFVI